jgi:DNA-binding MarR family transcriptional regulator
MYNLLVQDHEITQGVGYVLIIIPREGIPSTSIAPIMGMGSSSLTRLLKSMEASGLIYRDSNQTDRRVTLIHLTEKGSKLRKKIKELVVSFNQKVIDEITIEELKTYNKVSEIIRKHVEIELIEQQRRKNNQ